jgi:nucleotide-binding universal stress UspA family protein
VATDGSRASNAALKIAKLMADRNLWRPRVVTVFEPLPVSAADMTLGIPAPPNQQLVSDSLLAMIRRQIRRHGDATWDLRTEFGRSAPTIVRAAKADAVELIVLGLGHHGKLARWLGAETAARVARHSSVPVLAVDAKAGHLPETILVAIDFGESSIRAARESAALLGPRGRLHLLHVKWAMDDKAARDTEWDRTYDLGVDLGFKRLVDALQRVSNAEIITDVRRGGTIETTLNVAREIDADVIALGSHNQNIVDRMVIGYTPGAMLRAAHCSVLIAPPVDRAS